MNVLVVDDSEIFRTLIGRTLESAGFRVHTASDGVEAMRWIEEGRARLVVTDWEMPRMGGLELCHAVRGSDLPAYVFILLVTAHHTPAERVQGLAAGADDLIAKPFEPAELIERVRVGERILGLETRDVAIFALAKLAESRDPETGAHLERVQLYSRALARRLAAREKYRDRIDAEFIRLIFQTSPLHDIGKVGIPDSVLLKPDRLNQSEFEIMKTHAAIGAETLDAALERYPDAGFLRMARDIAASHHEWWNGQGYPLGLHGEDIPLSGRIVAVADVYDALTSKRIYKGAFTHSVARDLIVKESGSHFDPEVVAAFLDREEEFIEIHNLYDDTIQASKLTLAPLPPPGLAPAPVKVA